MKTGHLARLFSVNEKYTNQGNKKNVTPRSGHSPLFTTDRQVFRHVRVGFIICYAIVPKYLF